MDFDALMNLPWSLPTADVATPKPLIARGQPAHYTVRMATADEMAKANNIKSSLDKIRAMVSALNGAGIPQQAEALSEWLGLGMDQLAEDYIRQIEYVLLCTVNPPLKRQHVIWLARFQPFFFKNLFEQIMLLSFEGADLGEAMPSTETPESETPSLSAA